MNVLQLTDPGVKKALKHEALAGKKRIGRGSYSAIYDNGDSVLKLTADEAHYELLTGYARGLKPLPQMWHDYGDIGQQESLGAPVLYLFEVEKLVKVPTGTDAAKLVRKLCKNAARIMHEKGPIFDRHPDKIGIERIVPETFYQLAEDKELPADLRDALESLARFSLDFDGVGMDFHPANFMVRPSTGELVMSDPINSINIIHAAYTTAAGKGKY